MTNYSKKLYEYLIYESVSKDLFVKNKYKLTDKDLDIIKKVEVSDKYLMWLSNQYKINNRFEEDINRYKEAILLFDKNKNKIVIKDILKIKTLHELESIVKEFEGVKSNREEIKGIKKEGIDIFYEDSKWLVIIPKTFEASCYYGKNTKWCTTSDKSVFAQYTKTDPLYIAINKQTNEKYQYHISTGQYMDAEDVDINLIKKFPELKKVIQKSIKDYLSTVQLNNGTFALKYDDGYVIVDKNVNILTNSVYKNIYDYNKETDSYEVKTKDDLSGIIKSDGKTWILEPIYTYIYPYNKETDSYRVKTKDDLWGIIKSDGKTWIQKPK